VIFRRRSGFHDLVGRQLELFAVDEGDLLSEARDAERAWQEASRDDAEEAYGDYQLVLDVVGDRLLDIRETYAATLDEGRADAYRKAFTRAASKRFGHAATVLRA
jgi:hypothetical protein